MGSNDITELAIGDEIEITYNGSNGSRTITAYVVENFDPYPSLDGEKTRIRAAEPGARRPRFVRFDAGDEESYTLLKSENTKAVNGQRLGRVEDVDPTGVRSDEHIDVAGLMEADEGCVVEADGRERVVIDASHTTVTVEDPDGGDRTRYTARPDGVHESYESETVPFNLLGEAETDIDAEMTIEAIASWGHETGEVASGIIVDGVEYDVVYRHDEREDGIRLASPDADESRRGFDTRLTIDPIGLTFITGLYRDGDTETERIDADDVEIVFEPRDEVVDDD